MGLFGVSEKISGKRKRGFEKQETWEEMVMYYVGFLTVYLVSGN